MPAGVLFLAALAACVPVTPLSVSPDRGDTRRGCQALNKGDDSILLFLYLWLPSVVVVAM